MANIEDKNKWEEVYEIATTDPVMGGKNGVTNKPLQQLANRTKYLKEQLETTQQNTDSELDRKVSKSGDTMTGDLNLGNHKLKFNNDVSIGCENDNLYIREPEDTADSGGKEWLRIEDDNAAFIFGNRILTENDVSSSVSSTSTTDLASSKAAKTAYDKAVDAKTVADNAKSSADGKVSKSGDTMTGDLNLGNHKLKFNNDVSIGCENDNLYIREPEDTADSGGKEWLRIEDDNAAFIFGNRILTENDVSSSVSSTSTTDLASSKAAKTAYDKAVDAKTVADNAKSSADGKVSKSGDTMTGDLNLGNHKLKFNNDVSIGCENDNLYIREPEDTADSGGKEWLRIEDDNAAFIFGKRVLTEDDVRQIINDAVPAGTVIAKASGATPDGYLWCSGASVSRTAYPRLFSAIGTTYGSNNSSSFNVPDYRGLHLKGVPSGSSCGAYEGDAMRNVTGQITGITSEGINSGGAFRSGYASGGTASGSGGYNAKVTFDLSRVVPTADEVRVKSRLVHYFIKY